MHKKLSPLHPGEMLREFMEPLNLTAYTLAAYIGVPRTRIERIIKKRIGITADTALRLGAFFHTTPEFWMNLQSRCELETARREKGMTRRLQKIADGTRRKHRRYTMKQLLAGLTKQKEIDWGPPVGNEYR
jgi:addiction module HigA family antidote